VDTNEILRGQLSYLLEHSEAHTNFDQAVADIAPEARGVIPVGLPHSAWELLGHIRFAQRDILDFRLEAEYSQHAWPDDYWPAHPEPPSVEAWDESIAAVRRDREEFQRVIEDPATDLFAVVPHGTTQTYLREALLSADHNAFHVGQLMAVKRLV
jgi:hypothetical protein